MRSPIRCRTAKKAHSPFVFPRLSAPERSAPASQTGLSAEAAPRRDFPSAMRAARREEPRRSPNLCDKPITSAKTIASARSQCAQNHRPAAGEMLSRAGRLHFQFYNFSQKSQCEQRAEKNRAALRIFAITSAKTSASARSQCAQNHRPAAGEMLSRAGCFHRLVLQFFTEKPECEKPMRTARREEPHRSPNLCDKQRRNDRFSPFSICAKPSPRRRRNALPGGAFASHGFTIFHGKANANSAPRRTAPLSESLR